MHQKTPNPKTTACSTPLARSSAAACSSPGPPLCLWRTGECREQKKRRNWSEPLPAARRPRPRRLRSLLPCRFPPPLLFRRPPPPRRGSPPGPAPLLPRPTARPLCGPRTRSRTRATTRKATGASPLPRVPGTTTTGAKKAATRARDGARRAPPRRRPRPRRPDPSLRRRRRGGTARPARRGRRRPRARRRRST